jgi:hypothetical protein
VVGELTDPDHSLLRSATQSAVSLPATSPFYDGSSFADHKGSRSKLKQATLARPYLLARGDVLPTYLFRSVGVKSSLSHGQRDFGPDLGFCGVQGARAASRCSIMSIADKSSHAQQPDTAERGTKSWQAASQYASCTFRIRAAAGA